MRDKEEEGRKPLGGELAKRPQRAVHTDIKSVRKNEQSIRTLKRILAALIVIFVGLVIYVTYPLWLPRLEGIFDKPVTTITNDGELAGGNFPLSLVDSASADIHAVKNYLLTADAHTLDFYDANGKQRASYSHEFSNHTVKVSEKRVLVMDVGSTGFKIFNKSGEVYSRSAEGNILTGDICENGTAAVVCESDKYAASMLVYDADGKLIYRYSSTHRIMSVTLDEDGGGCYICTFSSENGEIYSQVRRVDFDSEEERMSSTKLDCLAIECCENDSGNIFVVGDCAAYIIDASGNLLSVSEYSGDISGYAIDSGCVAVTVKESMNNSGKLLTAQASAGAGEAFYETPLEEPAVAVGIYEERVVIMTSSQVLSYAFSGTLAATAQLAAEYEDFVYIDNALYLLSLSGVDKMGYEM